MEKKRFFAVTVLIMLFGVFSAAIAGTPISDNVSYWYSNGSSVSTVFDPGSEWLSQNSSNLLLRVEQTVYNADDTASILSENDITAPTGSYLFSYSVTNLGWKPSSSGLTGFAVNWGFQPLLVTTDITQTVPSWDPEYYYNTDISTSVDGPAWIWKPAKSVHGLLVGSTVGGLWALSPTSNTGAASAVSFTGNVITNPSFIAGQTTAPIVPEPASLLAMLTGVVGICGRFFKRA